MAHNYARFLLSSNVNKCKNSTGTSLDAHKTKPPKNTYSKQRITKLIVFQEDHQFQKGSLSKNQIKIALPAPQKTIQYHK